MIWRLVVFILLGYGVSEIESQTCDTLTLGTANTLIPADPGTAWTGPFALGATLNHTCVAGASFTSGVSSKLYTCTNISGTPTWFNPTDACDFDDAVWCPPIGSSSNGSIVSLTSTARTIDGGYRAGTTANLACRGSGTVVGNSASLCQPNTTWTLPLGTCTFSCGNPGVDIRNLNTAIAVPANGWSGPWNLGEQLIHFCRQGTLFPNGDTIRVYDCTLNSQWNPTWSNVGQGYCDVWCLPNGGTTDAQDEYSPTVLVDGYYEGGTSLVRTCLNNAQIFAGSNVATCTGVDNTGTFSGIGICKRWCPGPAPPLTIPTFSTTANINGVYEQGTVVNLTCEGTAVHVGNPSAVCADNGSFPGLGFCKLECGRPAVDLRNVATPLSSEINGPYDLLSQLVMTCMSGTSYSTGQATLTILCNASTPTSAAWFNINSDHCDYWCPRLTAVSLTSDNYTGEERNSRLVLGSAVQRSCTPPSILFDGPATATCQNTTTFTLIGSCLFGCTGPPPLNAFTNLLTSNTGAFKSGSVVDGVCSSGATTATGGVNETYTCQEDGTWLNQGNLCQCNPSLRIPVTPITGSTGGVFAYSVPTAANGAYATGTTATLSCPTAGQTVSGAGTVTCQADGTFPPIGNCADGCGQPSADLRNSNLVASNWTNSIIEGSLLTQDCLGGTAYSDGSTSRLLVCGFTNSILAWNVSSTSIQRCDNWCPPHATGGMWATDSYDSTSLDGRYPTGTRVSRVCTSPSLLFPGSSSALCTTDAVFQSLAVCALGCTRPSANTANTLIPADPTTAWQGPFPLGGVLNHTCQPGAEFGSGAKSRLYTCINDSTTAIIGWAGLDTQSCTYWCSPVGVGAYVSGVSYDASARADGRFAVGVTASITCVAGTRLYGTATAVCAADTGTFNGLGTCGPECTAPPAADLRNAIVPSAWTGPFDLNQEVSVVCAGNTSYSTGQTAKAFACVPAPNNTADWSGVDGDFCDEGDYVWEPSGNLEHCVQHCCTPDMPCPKAKKRPILAHVIMAVITLSLIILAEISAIRANYNRVSNQDCDEKWDKGVWGACADACGEGGGEAVLRSRVVREGRGWGRRCRELIRANCARQRRLGVLLPTRKTSSQPPPPATDSAEPPPSGADIRTDGAVLSVVCPAQDVGKLCQRRMEGEPIFGPDWAHLYKGSVFTLRFDAYQRLFTPIPANLSTCRKPL